MHKELKKQELLIVRRFKRLNLTLNRDKTFCIARGSKKQRLDIKAEFAKKNCFVEKLNEKFNRLDQTLSSGVLLSQFWLHLRQERAR